MFTDKETLKTRLDACSSCEFKKNIVFIPLCVKCGCIIVTKAQLPDSKCPIGKW